MSNRLVHKKQFELKDHLGNVRAIISDCKNPEKGGAYRLEKTAEIQNINNYYSFGMPMHRRNYTSSLGSYDFGYNGKLKDDELKGEGNSLDFGARIYDSRLGRFLSLDPLMKDYPMMTPYCFVGNMPISAIDPNGKEIWFVLQAATTPMFSGHSLLVALSTSMSMKKVRIFGLCLRIK